MDPQLLAFQRGALADAVTTLGRSVAIQLSATVIRVFKGIRSELQVDPGQLTANGFKYTRVFQIRFNDPTLVDLIKPGMSGTDDQGVPFKVSHFKVDHLGVLFYMGSINA